MRRSLAVVACVAGLALGGCGTGDEPSAEPSRAPSDSASAGPATAPATPSPSVGPSDTSNSPPPTAPPPPTKPVRPRPRAVLAISVDGLSLAALEELGPSGAPALHRLLEEGAGTLEARTEVEQTVTLPNHAGMLTGRRIDAELGGHGLTWNVERPGATVPGRGDGVASVFDVVHEAGGSTALFAGKDKFATFERSWPDAIDEFEVDDDPVALVAAARADLVEERRRLTFVHLASPDVVGHDAGWMSGDYLEAVADTDRLLGDLLATVDATPRLARRAVVVLTADHGGPPGGHGHDDAAAAANYRVPFLVWGAGIGPADLYDLNPDFRDPGSGRPAYDGPQPVRNGDLANLVTDLLGLGPVPGSELNADQDLDVR